MFDCLLRISEVVAVNVADLKEKTLTLRSSKSDQEGTGESLYVCDATPDNRTNAAQALTELFPIRSPARNIEKNAGKQWVFLFSFGG